MPKISEVVAKLDQLAPKWLAEKWDNVGLLIGDPQATCQHVMFTLDVRPEVVQEAIAKQVDLLIAHHPPIFSAIKQLNAANPQEKMYMDLIKHDIAVYVAHTNLDHASDGINDWLAEQLGLVNLTILDDTINVPQMKIVVYVPITHTHIVQEALATAGFGTIGEYSACSFKQTGTGYFKPTAQAQPFIGHADTLEQVQEDRLEISVAKQDVAHVQNIIRQVHPYEEVVIDVYPLEQTAMQYGLGRIGDLPEPMSLQQLLTKVATQLHTAGIRYVCTDTQQRVSRVAICGGSAEKYYAHAVAKGADVYITGDVSYHVAHDMLAAGLSVIDPGHYIESVCKERLFAYYTQWNQAEQWQLQLSISEVNTDPFQFYKGENNNGI